MPNTPMSLEQHTHLFDEHAALNSLQILVPDSSMKIFYIINLSLSIDSNLYFGLCVDQD